MTLGPHNRKRVLSAGSSPTQYPFGATGGYQVEAETAPSFCFRLESRVSRRKGSVSIN